jgi:hypothetical protein
MTVAVTSTTSLQFVFMLATEYGSRLVVLVPPKPVVMDIYIYCLYFMGVDYSYLLSPTTGSLLPSRAHILPTVTTTVKGSSLIIDVFESQFFSPPVCMYFEYVCMCVIINAS